ncbi:MAG: iron chelate uptake ABC transporter family permease subunit, partial [Spirochaetales bacterium]|nr:iron chelate uptake ABC transporter family permease subunit [Spirochaetales bacterium]
MRRIRTFREFLWPAMSLAVFWFLSLVLSVNVGPDGALWAHGWIPRVWNLVFWELRLPRALLAGIVGAGLGGAGAFKQTIFRNPLASPEILGVSAGASTGAVTALLMGFSGLWGLGLGAFAGAVLVTSLVFLLNSSRPSLTGVLLAGLALSSLLSAISSLLLLLSGEVRLSQYFFWLAGSLENRRWEHVIFAAVTVLPALLVLFLRTGRLNLATLGDETAA